MGFELSFLACGSGGVFPFFILSQMAFAFNALVLYVPNKGSLKWGFSTRESTPLTAVSLPVPMADVGAVRPLTEYPDEVPPTDGGLFTVDARREGVCVWRPKNAHKL
jgi:hypothetical protein